ncbi:MAG: pantetheine-phosphate adenylyltransferase [Candidatus Latescibacterota bacterium]|nr:MAG: pantetheine-phosphate adenylyltransferase [Candidatus Latescibacterota bacterium]
MTKALYPGTFDPITNGHLDVIKRASRLFDTLVVAVAKGVHKKTYFPLATRKRLIKESAPGMNNVEVVSLPGLLAEQCERMSVDVVIRGLRALSDFEYEMMMALMNRKLYPKFETVFLMPSERYIYLHSSTVKEVFALGGDVSDLVPEPVHKAFLKKRKNRRSR